LGIVFDAPWSGGEPLRHVRDDLAKLVSRRVCLNHETAGGSRKLPSVISSPSASVPTRFP
ncbi:MAG: hypothetical protein WBZ19_30485, partial [Chthoniobacterales bacterium]